MIKKLLNATKDNPYSPDGTINLMCFSYINSLIIMTTLFIKSLLTSLYQREDLSPSLAKRGKGRFSDLCGFNFETLNKLFIEHADISI